MNIRAIGPAEAERFRDIRLVALRDAPEAFGSDYRSEVDRPLEAWIKWLSSGLTLVAEDGDGWHGLVVGQADANDAHLVHIYSMWVAPSYRRGGIGRRLLDEIVDWAWRSGARRVRLAAADGNEEAVRLYRSYGFIPTGHREPLRSDPVRGCAFMELSHPRS